MAFFLEPLPAVPAQPAHHGPSSHQKLWILILFVRQTYGTQGVAWAQTREGTTLLMWFRLEECGLVEGVSPKILATIKLLSPGLLGGTVASLWKPRCLFVPPDDFNNKIGTKLNNEKEADQNNFWDPTNLPELRIRDDVPPYVVCPHLLRT
uniref:Uncharacterized protein n=1 Tax=Fagus sylvatica TaxID=28930 RepID=A0A2N9G2D5_FAGSY